MFELKFNGNCIDVDKETNADNLRKCINWLAYEHGKESGVNYQLEKQIAELQEKLHNANNQIENYKNLLADVKHRRNMQIADLKKKVSEEANDLYNLMHTIREMDYAKQDNDTKRYDYWNNRLGQIIHIQPYGKVKD